MLPVIYRHVALSCLFQASSQSCFARGAQRRLKRNLMRHTCARKVVALALLLLPQNMDDSSRPPCDSALARPPLSRLLARNGTARVTDTVQCSSRSVPAQHAKPAVSKRAHSGGQRQQMKGTLHFSLTWPEVPCKTSVKWAHTRRIQQR